MKTTQSPWVQRQPVAFTLIEVVVSIAVLVIVMAGMFEGYSVASQRALFASYNLAANAMASAQVEKTIEAAWKQSGTLSTNEFNPVLTNPVVSALCMPMYGSNILYATNYATVTQISNHPPYVMVQVNCVWSYRGIDTHTNTVAVLRAADL